MRENNERRKGNEQKRERKEKIVTSKKEERREIEKKTTERTYELTQGCRGHVTNKIKVPAGRASRVVEVVMLIQIIYIKKKENEKEKRNTMKRTEIHISYPALRGGRTLTHYICDADEPATPPLP